jgi:glycosyltransferase involved in cell wall biosynthesis
MTQPLISVVIPMYNAAATIERALVSVRDQTRGSFEVIVVNDGSGDGGAAIVERFKAANTDPKLTIHLINKANGGVSSARNAGLKVARGEYIALLDADDSWLPQKTDRQLKAFEINAGYSFIGNIITPVPIKRFFFKKFGIFTEIRLIDLIFKNYFQPSTVMMKREVYEKIGLFEETQRYAEEGNYFMRVANSFRCLLLNEKLILYGDEKKGFGESGLSGNLKEMEKGELRNLRFAYDQRYINAFVYNVARLYSLVKYVRRIVVTKMRS